jgi:hypothetical protein
VAEDRTVHFIGSLVRTMVNRLSPGEQSPDDPVVEHRFSRQIWTAQLDDGRTLRDGRRNFAIRIYQFQCPVRSRQHGILPATAEELTLPAGILALMLANRSLSLNKAVFISVSIYPGAKHHTGDGAGHHSVRVVSLHPTSGPVGSFIVAVWIKSASLGIPYLTICLVVSGFGYGQWHDRDVRLNTVQLSYRHMSL